MQFGDTIKRLILTLLWALSCAASTAAQGAIELAQATNLFEREPTPISVDIKPGDPDNAIRTRARREIEVAILGTPEVDTNAINPRTIRLKGVDVLLVGKSDKSLCTVRDINADGLPDLVCEVRTTGFRVAEGEYRIVIEAATYKGESMRGEDRIKITP